MNERTLQNKLNKIEKSIERVSNMMASDGERENTLDAIVWLYKWKHISYRKYLSLVDRLFEAYQKGGYVL